MSGEPKVFSHSETICEACGAEKILMCTDCLEKEDSQMSASRPAWRDAPSCPGRWVWHRGDINRDDTFVEVEKPEEWPADGDRFFGPISVDKSVES